MTRRDGDVTWRDGDDATGARPECDRGVTGQVPGFPTWEIKGELFPGEKSVEELAKISGFQP